MQTAGDTRYNAEKNNPERVPHFSSLIFYVNYYIIYWHPGVAELVDALDLESSGRPWGFESLSPDHIRTENHLRKDDFLFIDVSLL